MIKIWCNGELKNNRTTSIIYKHSMLSTFNFFEAKVCAVKEKGGSEDEYDINFPHRRGEAYEWM